MVLIFGTGLAQLIPMALQPIIRRLFTDEDFGLFAQYYFIVAILSVMASLRYEVSIVIPKEEKSGIALLAGAIFINSATSIFFFIILFFFGLQIYDALGFSRLLFEYTWIMPISIFLLATNTAFNYWLTRKKMFKGLVYNKAVRRGSEGAARLGLGYAGKTSGLIIGSIIGDLINLIMFLFQFFRSGGSFKGVDKKQIKTALKEQEEFPKYALLPAMLNVITTHLPIFLLSSLYTKAIVGQFDASRELLAVPLALVSISISQVLFQKIVEDVANGRRISRLMRNNGLVLGGLGVIGILIFMNFGVPIFTFLFGDTWVLAGQLSAVLVISYAIRFVVSPLSIIFSALKKLKIGAYWQVGYFLLMLNLLFFRDLSVEDFLWVFVLFDVFAYLVYAVMIWYIAKKQDDLILTND
ncbi:MAG: lipopolysaccharide biosynthesis protein [Crocinitomicaceae bacterium]